MDDDRADDHGGFVFGDERAADADATDDRVPRRAVAAAVFVVALLLFAAVAYPFVSSAVTGLFGGGSDDAGAANGTTEPGDTSGGELAGEQTTTTDAPGERADTTPDVRTPTDTAKATATATDGSTPTATPTPTRTDTTETATADTATSAAPTVESFTVTDRSAGGTARFDVGWNVTDADSDLVAVRVTIVADPDGEARTVAQRRFDAGGARTAGGGSFEVPEGSGAAYEIGIEVADGGDNTAFELTRVVADGEPDS